MMNAAVINFALFQLGWLACVIGGAKGIPWFGPVIVLAIITYHLYRAERPGLELRLIVFAILLGTFWDSLLVTMGWLTYPSGMVSSNLAPYWIVALWALFSTTLNVSLKWMKGRLITAALFGAVGAPLAYWAGSRLGGVELTQPITAMMALAIGWLLIMPTLMQLSERFNGFNAPLNARA